MGKFDTIIHDSQGLCLTVLAVAQGMSLSAADGPFQTGLPKLECISQECIEAASSSNACLQLRLHMQLSTPVPAFYGAMNISGDLRAWSFTGKVWPDQAGQVSSIVRFAGSAGSEQRNFWVRHC